MSDTRRRKLARLLVDYSTQVQPGDWVGILGNFGSLPILREIHAAVIDAGGFPSLYVEDEQMQRYFLRNANDNQMQWVDPGMRLYVDEADVYIRALAPENTRAMSNIDAQRLQIQRAAQSDILQTRLQRSAAGKFRWVGTLFPVPGIGSGSQYELRGI